MQVLNDLNLHAEDRPVVMAAGFFDGVHIGHGEVIRRTIAGARERGGSAWAFTFDVHPMEILKPDSAPRPLTRKKHKIRLLEGLGLDGCIVLPFQPGLATLSPEQFVDRLCSGVPRLAEIVVGDNWRFGKGAKGDVELLSRLGRERGFSVAALPPVMWSGQPVSSTRIRSAVKHGDLDAARAMLGRHSSILGSVARGRSVGARLGFPTANIDYENEVLPPLGVYAALASVPGEPDPMKGVANLGLRPSFHSEKPERPQLEIHLFGFEGHLYGHDIEVSFVKKIRDEKRFKSEQALQDQIRRDAVEAARAFE